MNLYNYKKFLDKYNSDKIVKKYFALKREAKERENLRKIGLDEYFKPVTSVNKKELKPFHNLIRKQKNKKNQEDTLGDDEDTLVEDEDTLMEDEDTLEDDGAIAGEIMDDKDEYLSSSEEKEKKYEETKNFLSFQELNKNYPEKERGTQEYLRYWKNVAKNMYDIDFDNLPSNFNNLTDEELKIKQNNLNDIRKSSNSQEKYNPDIKIIDNITDDLLREIQAIKRNRKEFEKIEEEFKKKELKEKTKTKKKVLVKVSEEGAVAVLVKELKREAGEKDL